MQYSFCSVLGLLTLFATAALGQETIDTNENNDGRNDQWAHYGGSPGGGQYSAVNQVTPDNVGNLREVWRFQTGELYENMRAGPMAFEANPILAEGKLYISTPTSRAFAIDPATGAKIWEFDGQLAEDKFYAEIAVRGVSSWIDPLADTGAPCRHRIFMPTLDGRIFALDGETGTPCADFGAGGYIDLNEGTKPGPPGEWITYTVTSPPVIAGDLLISGSAIGDNPRVEMELGIVRAFDIRTGKLRWSWDPIPRTPDNPAYVTWSQDQAAVTGAANAWPPLSVDENLDLVFIPTGSASPDFYGGERIGNNLYANSLVALRASTGAVVWYQQLVHHDVWDYDLPAQPAFMDIKRDGKIIPAVIQATKMGMLFTFNRATGEPIFEIEERAVPQGGVPGEVLSPTQPFPVAPPAVISHAPVTPDDAWGPMWIGESACRAEIEGYRSEGIYTPPSLEGTLQRPMYGGGMNWGGVAVDEARQMVVTNAINLAAIVVLEPQETLFEKYESGVYSNFDWSEMAGAPYGMRRRLFMSELDIPCIKHSWGVLTGIDMSDGSIAWQVDLGTTDGEFPLALNLGMPNMGGAIVTGSGLTFIAATTDKHFRAYRTETGEKLWDVTMPAAGISTPMTYYLEETNKQYIVVSAGGHGRLRPEIGDYVIGYALGPPKRGFP